MICKLRLWLLLVHGLAAISFIDGVHKATASTSARIKGYEHPATNGSYLWFTKPATRQLAQLLPGNQARLRKALAKYQDGANITVTAVGGSITAGQGAHDAPDYVAWLQMALHGFMDPKRVQVHNGGLQGTLSSYMSMCHNMHVPRATDVVFVEYALNDVDVPYPLMDNNHRRPFERLLRKLLAYPNQPAVVLLNAYRWFQASQNSPLGSYWTTAEREFNEFAQYYALPVLSVRSGVYHLMVQGVEGYQVERPRADIHGRMQYGELGNALRGKAFYYDVVHPDGHTGHRVMGELAAQLILDAWASIQHEGLTPQEEASVAQQLLAPLLPNNYAAMVDKCFVGPQFVRTVTSSEGWEWRNEGRPAYPKFGYIGMEVGKRLQMRVNSTSPSGIKDQRVTVQVAYLKSYVAMGSASLTCEGGCTCETEIVEAHQEQRNSQLFLAPIAVTQHPECLVTVTILPESKSGNHKFKLAGIMVSDEAADIVFDNWAAVSIVHNAATMSEDGMYLKKNASPLP